MQRRQTIWVGILLIVAGIWALLSALNVPLVGMDQLWPAIVMLGGAVVLYGALARSPRDSGGVWFGVAALLSGAYFLYITIGPGQWSDLETSWPIFPVIGAVAWLAAWVVDLRQVSNLVMAIIAGAVGALGVAYTYGMLEPAGVAMIAQYWPLILVLIGIGLIVQYLVRRR